MDCLALCFYLSAYAGMSSSSIMANFEVTNIEQNGNAVSVWIDSDVKTGDFLGNITMGIENKHGLFLEFDHTSGLNSSSDRGWEELRVGIRKKWDLFR